MESPGAGAFYTITATRLSVGQPESTARLYDRGTLNGPLN